METTLVSHGVIYFRSRLLRRKSMTKIAAAGGAACLGPVSLVGCHDDVLVALLARIERNSNKNVGVCRGNGN